MWHYFPEHYMFSYQLVRILAQAHFGGGEFNECLEAASRITPGDFESFYQSWNQTGDTVLAEAEAAMQEHRSITAHATYLRAANYFRMAEFFLQPDDHRKNETYGKGVAAFRKAMELTEHPPRRVEIPFEGQIMSGYFFEVPGQKKGPLVIMFGGLDSTAEELFFGPYEMLNDRGISLLILDGPGQGESLRLRDMLTRYDYNVPATAAFDWAIANLDVDPARIGIMAVSMGGYMAARSAAFEHRFRACGIWSAVYSYYDVWANRPDSHPLSRVLCHIVGVKDMAEARGKLEHFKMAGIAGQIQCPTYISHGGDDRQVPVSQAQSMFDELTCEKYLHIVPKESTGSAHCHVDNMTKVLPLFDWMQEQLS
ncbi:alpha/beta hydrolase family protein [Hymenobacter jejuensis]|uniref:Alpha/beta hydrolase n=1 Tax=Hymenobacter jejuensis TaxID=2502781 RepID=A0A5B8A6F4_9BACT|nr:alpha/beta hydrolase [Hymenobacter jejuensis]QDA62363.1 alpha/beta hydrolase [Hymenobacter jejuensis]